MENLIKGTWEEFRSKIRIKAHTRTAYAEINTNTLADLFQELENREITVKNIYLNAKTYNSVRKWGRDCFDVEKDQERIKKGYMGQVWGATFICSSTVPDNVILITSEGDTDGAVLSMNVDIPGAKELIDLHNSLRGLAGNMQSLLSEAFKIIQKIVTQVEKINN
jgi:hypothetical protein